MYEMNDETEEEDRKIGADIVEVSFPHVPPEHHVGAYFKSKAQNGKIVKYPEWDVVRSDPTMKLLWARRELIQAQQRLQTKRSEFIERREKLDADWEDLTQKEQNLRKNVIMFHKFVKENQEKKERATRRINEEKLIHQRRNDEIASIQERIDKMTNVRNSLQESVEKLKTYDDYISNVVAVSPEFRSVISVLNRYDALSTARKDLVTRQKADLEQLEEERINMMKLVEERVDVLMGLNNRLAELQAQYEKTKAFTQHWETVLYKVKNKSSYQLLNLYLVENSIWNLYQQMCVKKNMPVDIPQKNIEEQLLYIKYTINEYKRVDRMASRRIAKDLMSVISSKSRIS